MTINNTTTKATTSFVYIMMTIYFLQMMQRNAVTAFSGRMVVSMSTNSATKVIIPRIKTANAMAATDHPVIVKGWVRTIRKQKTLAFVEVNDGSNLNGIQCVLTLDQMNENMIQGECVCACVRAPVETPEQR